MLCATLSTFVFFAFAARAAFFRFSSEFEVDEELESLLPFESDRRGSRRDGDDRWLESRLRLERARRDADFRCLECSRLRFEWLECDAWWWPEFSLLSFEGDRLNWTCRADES